MVTPELRAEPIRKPKLLLVEGRDEFYVFIALLDRIDDLPEIEVRSYDGKDNLGPFLRSLVAMNSFRSVTSMGILRDADQDRDQAFRSVASALQSANLPTPSQPLESSGTNPRVIVEIIPPNSAEGELEDVLLESVNGDPSFSCIDEFISCLESQMNPLPGKLSKVRLHSFLASRKEPGKKAGEAMKAGYFPCESEAFTPIIDVLRLL